MDFVRPNYLGTRTEFSNMFERPIQVPSRDMFFKVLPRPGAILYDLLGFVYFLSQAAAWPTRPLCLPFKGDLYLDSFDDVNDFLAFPLEILASYRFFGVEWGGGAWLFPF